MMGGLAYMTGRPGDPLRAGASVNDIMGGMFGAIGAMAALAQREHTGARPGSAERAVREQRVPGGPAHDAVRRHRPAGRARCRAASRPGRVYDVFTVKDGEQIFLAAVSDTQWTLFCEAFGFGDLLGRPAPEDQQRPGAGARLDDAHPALAPGRSQRGRAERGVREERPAVRAHHQARRTCSMTRTCNATGGLAPLTLPDGRETQVPLLPLTLGGERPGRAPAAAPARRAQRRAACASSATTEAAHRGASQRKGHGYKVIDGRHSLHSKLRCA